MIQDIIEIIMLMYKWDAIIVIMLNEIKISDAFLNCYLHNNLANRGITTRKISRHAGNSDLTKILYQLGLCHFALFTSIY